jgi:DNA-binding MurR/RpiR family transcriptional regulator
LTKNVRSAYDRCADREHGRVGEEGVTRVPSGQDVLGAVSTNSVVTVSIRSSIQSHIDRFPPSTRRVADAILERPQVVLEQTITELAHRCDTSETSVVRFCRALGFTGYAPLRLQMATELAKESAQFGTDAEYGSDITPTDSLAQMVAKIDAAEVMGIQETGATLDIEALGQIIERIASARTVVLFGVAASGAGARDLAQKLLRIGTAALWFADAHDALVPAALLGPNDVAVGFSHGGRSRETVAFLHTARTAGAFTVAITNVAESPLIDEADATLRTAVRETVFRSGAMASRIAQLTVVDYIFVGVARSDYDRSVESLRKTRESTRILREER